MKARTLFQSAVVVLFLGGAFSCSGTDNNAGGACTELLGVVQGLNAKCANPDGAPSPSLPVPKCDQVVGIRDSAKFSSDCIGVYKPLTCDKFANFTPPAACQELVAGDLFGEPPAASAGGSSSGAGGSPAATGGVPASTGGAATGSGGSAAGAGGAATGGGASDASAGAGGAAPGDASTGG